VVLGADSTTTFGSAGQPHYFNHAQKVFEIGQDSTLGIVTWGLGSLWPISHRTLIARFGDDLAAHPAASVSDVANRWTDWFWGAYTTSSGKVAYDQLNAKSPHDPQAQPPDPNARTADEENVFQQLRRLLVTGFCLGGHVLQDRSPAAFYIIFDPAQNKPVPEQITTQFGFWGAPNMIQRLISGCDDTLRDAILNSGHWSGTPPQLEALIAQQQLSHPAVPIRDAIDFVHVCILSTIKAMKFSSLSQICGGPIEVAVITSDRRFRWVKHKPWDAAIMEGVL
jgi:hypothetical protein